MGVHSAFKRIIDIFVECVGTNRHDRNRLGVLTSQCADGHCRFVTIHDRHLDIHENDTERIFIGFLEHLDTFLAVFGFLRNETGFMEQMDQDQPIETYVIDHQRLLSGETSFDIPGSDDVGVIVFP